MHIQYVKMIISDYSKSLFQKDKAHLGGFTSFDPMGVSPTMWKHMVEWLGVKSLLDVGCGIGTSTSWFAGTK